MFNAILQRSRLLWASRGWRRVFLLSTSALSASFLLWSLLRDGRTLLSYDWQWRWWPIALSSVIYTVALGFAILAWVLLMRALKAGLSWRQDARFFLYSWISRRLPTALPYLASRVLLYEQAGVVKRIPAVGLIWENVLLVTAGLLLALGLMPFTAALANRVALIPLAVFAVVTVVLVLHPTLLARAVNWGLRRSGRQTTTIAIGTPTVLLVLLIYALQWTIGGLILFLLINSLYPLDWAALPLVVQSWVLSGLVSLVAFFVPIGIGVTDLTLVALLTFSLSIPSSFAVVVVVLMRFWMMGLDLLWSFVFYRVRS